MARLLQYSTFSEVFFPPAVEGDASASNFVLRQSRRFRLEAGQSMPGVPIVVFDFETTGLDPRVDRIIEIGAQRLAGRSLDGEFSTLVHTDVTMTESAQAMTGITTEMLAGQPREEEVIPRFLEFIRGAVLVAHNAEFDMGFLRTTCARLGVDLEWPCFCTLKLARSLLPNLARKDLDTLAGHYGLTFAARHRSIGDVQVTSAVLGHFMRDHASRFATWDDLKEFKVV